MKRRSFLSYVSAGALLSGSPSLLFSRDRPDVLLGEKRSDLKAQVVVVGGGLGGCAAAIALCRNGVSVLLIEETDWLGGQISQQGVPPDEHQWIERQGAPASYRLYRSKVRQYYKSHYPLTSEAKSKKLLNPGDGSVSSLCHEPRVCVAVLNEMLNPFISAGLLDIMYNFKVDEAEATGDHVNSISLRHRISNQIFYVEAEYFIDATELGDLLPLAGIEYVTGTESKGETGELHAPEVGDPTNNQAFTLCFALDYRKGENHVIDKPEQYEFWRNYVPRLTPPWSGNLLDLRYSNPQTLEPRDLAFHPEGVRTPGVLNLWLYRRIINKENFEPHLVKSDVSIVNWPQNDFLEGNLIDVSDEEFGKTVAAAKQLNLSLLYWLQTEVPRPDGGYGWPGLRLRPDVMGTSDGMAKYPYIRESRRIRAQCTILEEHVGVENRKLTRTASEAKHSEHFFDSVGTGFYALDLHPSTNGNNTIDVPSLPFQIPLGAVLPIRVRNVFPASKNIGTTHITNGCYRLHPVEWSIGEAVGCLLAFSKKHRLDPHQVRANKGRLEEFQSWIRKQGLETEWG